MAEDKMNQRASFPLYVVVTPARNEAAFIEKTKGGTAAMASH